MADSLGCLERPAGLREGHRFDSVILHSFKRFAEMRAFFCLDWMKNVEKANKNLAYNTIPVY
jgi:hypothetical protein